MRIVQCSLTPILAAIVMLFVSCGGSTPEERPGEEWPGAHPQPVTDGRGFMIVSDTDPSLAIIAWGGAAEGTPLKLYRGCTKTNPDCTWTYGDGLLRSNRDPSLAIIASGGAAHGAQLRLSRNCASTNPDCRWLYTRGTFRSGADPALGINAYGGAAPLADVRLHSACNSDANSDCRWTMQRVMIRAAGQNYMLNAWGGASHLGPIKLTSACDSENPDCTFTIHRGMLISDRSPGLAVNAYGGAQNGTDLKLHKDCTFTNPDCTFTWANSAIFSDRNSSLMVNSAGGQYNGTQLKLTSACSLSNQDCLFGGQYGGDQCGRHGQAPCAGDVCLEGALFGTLCRVITTTTYSCPPMAANSVAADARVGISNAETAARAAGQAESNAVAAAPAPYPGQEVVNIYYSDATFRVAIGEEQVITCQGGPAYMIWGCPSPFYSKEAFPCETGGTSRTCITCNGVYPDGRGYNCNYVPCPWF